MKFLSDPSSSFRSNEQEFFTLTPNIGGEGQGLEKQLQFVFVYRHSFLSSPYSRDEIWCQIELTPDFHSPDMNPLPRIRGSF